ncbi:MAG: response regulator, partial [Haliea sp.]
YMKMSSALWCRTAPWKTRCRKLHRTWKPSPPCWSRKPPSANGWSASLPPPEVQPPAEPALKAILGALPPPAELKAPSVTIAVLLVEDVKQLRGIVADLLATLGDFKVVAEVATEAEAILWLEENPQAWDLAVVDLILEQGTGMGVVARCRDRREGAKVVVLSDYATPGIHKHCLNLGADAVFQKSHDVQDFMAWCSALLPPTRAQAATAPPKSPAADPPAQ